VGQIGQSVKNLQWIATFAQSSKNGKTIFLSNRWNLYYTVSLPPLSPLPEPSRISRHVSKG
jgi:hypothetical protein